MSVCDLLVGLEHDGLEEVEDEEPLDAEDWRRVLRWRKGDPRHNWPEHEESRDRARRNEGEEPWVDSVLDELGDRV